MAQSSFFLDSLLCQEQEYLCLEPESYNADSTDTQNQSLFIEQDLFWENEELVTLFSKENANFLYNEIQNDSLMSEMRGDAVEWILNVVARYDFSRVTAVLAVNYLDRFLCDTRLRREKPWMAQLAAVACLSLAAKVEETHVPLLLDLQVEDTRYVFEAKTIQSMEILVLTSLEWKMNPVTPISFIDHFARRLGFKNQFCCEFLSRCECLVVSLISDTRFMRFLPSALAIATMLHIINAIDPCLETEYQNQLLTTIKIDKDQLDDCFKLIADSTIGVYYKSNKRKLGSTMHGSPNRVMDICFSSDNSCDSWTTMSEASTPPSMTTSVSSSPEPISKKIRMLCPRFSL